MTTALARYPSLEGRTVFVTGGASGIGGSVVEHFCAQGATVHFADVAEEPAQRLVGSLRERPDHRTPVFHHVDLRDVDRLQGAIRESAADAGGLDVLVNNAAHDERHAVEDVTLEYWEDRMHVNLRHQFFAAQAALAPMRARGGGSIVNVGSSSWHVGQGGMPGYTTAKAGVEGLTRGLARDFGPDSIRVNCVIPGWVMTERQKSLWLTEEAEADLMNKQCLKEKLQPHDVARLVLWLSADDSRMCSNQNFIVDGGWI
ncbi:SDR family oxidoreductase [Arhodomonas aquaeolei]|uniref:SDR family NAD(P)-dependent oxidoreductase n=1 Tax=Arhodomonas aquaeolei TaxID=2369 RepID=UPI00216A53CA|nr:SDR family oxidoreductase [Arhodomonas aquaeolei]MCS4503636.1 SDR family oxidoreductase [Arhodomonas aquaeolei]